MWVGQRQRLDQLRVLRAWRLADRLLRQRLLRERRLVQQRLLWADRQRMRVWLRVLQVQRQAGHWMRQ